MLPLTENHLLYVRQRRELAELIGFETRNKYEILDASGAPIGFAAEQSKGWLGLLVRQFLGHWRRFEVHVFGNDRVEDFIAVHPFRWFFQRLEVKTPDGRMIGALEQRFAIFSKKFDVQSAQGSVVMEMRSPLWKIWTFPFKKRDREVAVIRKKWSGLLREAFTDGDRFEVEFGDRTLTQDERRLVLAASIFVDLQYFEKKAD